MVSKSLSKEERRQSISVAVITPLETKVFHFGKLSDGGEIANEFTIFEIGSLTKGYLGLLMAKAVVDGKINLDDQIPLKFQPHSNNGKAITWRHLANQTSGFPRLPTNIDLSNPLQPYKKYDDQKLLSFISNFTQSIEPGKKHIYSNLGAGVAGSALEEVYGKSLSEIFSELIAKPNHLSDTVIFLDSHQEQRQSPVFLNGQKVSPWEWLPSSSLQGGGAIKSTINDSINMMKTMMAIHAVDTIPYVALATRPTFEISSNSKIGLFWNHAVNNNIIWHNGGTAGSSSFFGYDPDALIGIIAFSNSQIITEGGLDPKLDIAAFNSLNELKQNSGSKKSLSLLKKYDAEITKQATAFEAISGDIEDAEWVKAKLTHMFEIDQYMRKYSFSDDVLKLPPRDRKFFDIAFMRRWFLLDKSNTEDMKILLGKYGWFEISKWGKEFDNKAWLLVQHADHDFDFQSEVLKILEGHLKTKETSPKNYAYLYDRVAVSDRNPIGPQLQKYGTQGTCVGPGEWEPRPIEKPEQVDRRRKAVGLPPLAEYIAVFKDICK